MCVCVLFSFQFFEFKRVHWWYDFVNQQYLRGYQFTAAVSFFYGDPGHPRQPTSFAPLGCDLVVTSPDCSQGRPENTAAMWRTTWHSATKSSMFLMIKLWLASYACTPANIQTCKNHAVAKHLLCTSLLVPWWVLSRKTVQDLWYGQSQLGAEIACAS